MNDKGPWSTLISETDEIIGILSEDFTHDVLLRVDGDFENDSQKIEYCERLAEKLNNIGDK